MARIGSTGDRSRPSKAALAILLAPIVVAIGAGTVASALFPTLLRDHKLLLIGLDARNRSLLPVAGRVAFVAFVLVATIRRFVTDPSFYLLGRIYGDDAVSWLERRAGEAGRFVRTMERLFDRIGPLLVFLFPGALVCVFAGATAMNPVLFTVLNVVGTIAVVILVWSVAGHFRGPISGFTGFVSDNASWLTVLSVVLTLVYLWDQRRRGKDRLAEIVELAGADDPEG